MKPGNSQPLAPELRAELEALAAMPDETIDTSDAPPVKNWTDAKRGAFYRPVKTALSLRLDADVVEWFRQRGEGYQTKINAALREYIEQHEHDHA